MAWIDEMKCLHCERSGGYKNISCMLGMEDTVQWKLFTFPPVSAVTCDGEFDFSGHCYHKGGVWVHFMNSAKYVECCLLEQEPDRLREFLVQNVPTQVVQECVIQSTPNPHHLKWKLSKMLGLRAGLIWSRVLPPPKKKIQNDLCVNWCVETNRCIP